MQQKRYKHLANHTVGRAMSFVLDFPQEVNDVASRHPVLHEHLSHPPPFARFGGTFTAVPDVVSSRDPSLVSV